MITKHIRCACGKIYDPAKHPVCPDCGVVSAVATAPEPVPEIVNPPGINPPPSGPAPAPGKLPIRAIAGVAALLLVFMTAVSRCGSHRPEPVPVPVPTPTPVPALIPSPSPTPSPKREEKTTQNDPPSPPSGTVNATETTDLSTLIAQCAAGTTIKLAPGKYSGPFILARPIHLVADAQASGQVIIQSSGVACLSIQSRDVSATNVRFVCKGVGQLATIAMGEGAELQLDNCTVETPTSFGVSLIGKATLKATGSTFTALQGTAVRLDRAAQATLTQCHLIESRFAFYAGAGSRLTLRSCAFQRNGDGGQGILFAVNGEGTEVAADDCQFDDNTGGAVIGQKAVIKITNSRFKNNGPGNGGGKTVEGLLSVRFGSKATLEGDTFEKNRQGVYVADGGTLEISKCKFAGNGVAGQQLVPGAFPLSVSGQNTVATVQETTFSGSLQFAMEVRGGARLTLDNVDVTDTQDVGLIVGDRNSPPATAEIKHSRFQRNLTAMGVFGGSSATIGGDSECVENRQGFLAFGRDTQLSVRATQFIGNTNYALRAYDGAKAFATSCTFTNNAIGVLSGTKETPAGRASITLDGCRFSGSQIFATGAAAQSELILRLCLFDGSDKLNVFKENGANVQIQNGAVPPSPK